MVAFDFALRVHVLGDDVGRVRGNLAVVEFDLVRSCVEDWIGVGTR